MKRIWIVTLFPEFFLPLKDCGVVGKALRGERGSEFELNTVYLGDCSPKGFKGVDDSPYGGGEGMVLRADVLKNSLDKIIQLGSYDSIKKNLHVIFPSPRGHLWKDQSARDFAEKLSKDFEKDLVFICGRYEGVDERFLKKYVDEEICLGNFILSGGDIATLAIIDSAMRFCPDVLGNKLSHRNESFALNSIEHAYYTRPLDFEGERVPDVLTGGDHGKQDQWRFDNSAELTEKYRPDLISDLLGQAQKKEGK